MMLEASTSIPLQPLFAGQRPWWCARLDQIGGAVSGNKWFKLMLPVQQALQRQRGIASFGGAFSNHLHALAHAGARWGFPTLAVVRGEPSGADARSPTLRDAEALGMQLHFVSRAEYRQRHEPHWLASWRQRFPDYDWLPEGGDAPEGLQGLQALGEQLNRQLERRGVVVVTAAGTGATAEGLLRGLDPLHRVMAVSVLKGYGAALRQRLASFSGRAWVVDDQHHGGYARLTESLVAYMDTFARQQSIALEPVYSGKAFLAAERLYQQGMLARDQAVVLLHTGGMQGLRGLQHTVERFRSGEIAHEQ